MNNPLICDECGGQMLKVEEDLYQCENPKCGHLYGKGHL